MSFATGLGARNPLGTRARDTEFQALVTAAAQTMQSPAPAPAHIEMRGLSYGRDGVPILTGIEADLRHRRIAVLGRNGSGKSTLLRALCGLIEPDAGDVLIDGVDVLRDRKGALRKIGILFQNPDHQIIFPTVGEEVAFGLRQTGLSKREAHARARAALDRFGRAAWQDRATATLSQGQRHLVCLIAVLAMEPAVIALDEPFSGLDIPTTRGLTRMLEQSPATLVHVTHDPRLVADYDHAIWLSGGRVAEQGPAGDVLPRFEARMAQEGEADAFADLPG